jgi:hypothetical protein
MHAHHPCHILRDWLLHPIHPGSPRSVDFAVHVNSYLHAYEIIREDGASLAVHTAASRAPKSQETNHAYKRTS